MTGCAEGRRTQDNSFLETESSGEEVMQAAPSSSSATTSRVQCARISSTGQKKIADPVLTAALDGIQQRRLPVLVADVHVGALMDGEQKRRVSIWS